jgi:pyruvate ferredoxin oxidoreductase beta subunit
MGGDGATCDIGLQALSGAWAGHNFIYVCFDNEAYMNTASSDQAPRHSARQPHLAHGKKASGKLPGRKICRPSQPLTTFRMLQPM